MEIIGEQLISAKKSAVWGGLNEPGMLKACISGCESLEKLSDTEFVIVTVSEVGPVRARFRGKLLLTDLDPPNSYTLLFDGQGGAAGFGKGSAKVSLQDMNGDTRLAYVVNIQVGGKLAQIGSRLVGGVANKVAEEFFTAFKKMMAPPELATPKADHLPASRPAAKPSRRFWWTAGIVAILVIIAMWRLLA